MQTIKAPEGGIDDRAKNSEGRLLWLHRHDLRNGLMRVRAFLLVQSAPSFTLWPVFPNQDVFDKVIQIEATAVVSRLL